MEYNTSLPKLRMPEYGRNIQKMIDYAVNVEDKEEKNRVARAIINVMGQLNPHLRDVTDFKHKLWDHLFIISDFELDVESPYPKPTRETFISKPDMLSYPDNSIRYKHYGKVIEQLIGKAKSMEAGEMKEALVEMIANLMKKSYLTWNRESVSDEVIRQHLEELSKGQLKLSETARLSHTNEILSRNYTNKKKNIKGTGKPGMGNGKQHKKNFKN